VSFVEKNKEARSMSLSGGISVTPVVDAAALDAFLRLPWRLYAQDPFWVPPLLQEQRRFMDPRYGPFFEIGQAQYFLAWQNGRPVGRISAHVNRRHDDIHGPDTGFFGFFECEDNPPAAQALLEAAAAWLRSQGKRLIQGPMNFSVYDEMGLLVEGFDTMPVIFQTHNPPYYEELLAGWGLVKAMDWHAYKITNREVDLEAMERRAHEILEKQKLTFARYHPREIPRRAREVYELFNAAWESNWGHVPLTWRQFEYFMTAVKPLLRPEYSFMLLDKDRLAGFGIALPDINPVVKEIDGNLNLWGKLRLWYAAKYAPVRRIRCLVVGFNREHQGQAIHLAAILLGYVHLVKYTPCEMGDLSLIPENIRHWIRPLRAFGAQRYKVFRVFQRNL
jgi:hypothetical protein